MLCSFCVGISGHVTLVIFSVSPQPCDAIPSKYAENTGEYVGILNTILREATVPFSLGQGGLRDSTHFIIDTIIAVQAAVLQHLCIQQRVPSW